MECVCGGYQFNSNFDSGNLARVECVSSALLAGQPDEQQQPTKSGVNIVADAEFNCYISPDAAGTRFQNGNRSWFHFSVRTTDATVGTLIRINIPNMNRQGKLYSQGYNVIYRSKSSGWDRIRTKPTYENRDGNFVLSFLHQFLSNHAETVYFAFCYPKSFCEMRNDLARLDLSFSHCLLAPPSETSSHLTAADVYCHREVITHSLDCRPMDLLTISGYNCITTEREERFDPKLFPDYESDSRPFKFAKKRVIILSSRVHPGETPGQFVFDGFLKFILRRCDPRAAKLRELFVFKLIPVLNPDGVARGHYRTDTRGVNLNRMYLDPDFTKFPTIYAVKALIVYHHIANRVRGCEAIMDDNLRSMRLSRTDVAAAVGSTAKKSDAPVAMIDDDVVETANSITFNVNFPSKSTLQFRRSSNGQAKRSFLKTHRMNFSEPGNEGSSSGGSDDELSDGVGGQQVFAPHLSSPELHQIQSNESGIAFYVDLHGHASKRGCFIYGNCLESDADQTEILLFSKVLSMNSSYFDYEGCNFSEKNMYHKDKVAGQSKEGSGRVAIYKSIGIVHSYTLECNYNMGRIINAIAAVPSPAGVVTPPPPPQFPPKYTPAHWEEVGRGLAVTMLDMVDANPHSRLTRTELRNIQGVREWCKARVLSLRADERVARKKKLAKLSKQGAGGVTATAGTFNSIKATSKKQPVVDSSKVSIPSQPQRRYPGGKEQPPARLARRESLKGSVVELKLTQQLPSKKTSDEELLVFNRKDKLFHAAAQPPRVSDGALPSVSSSGGASGTDKTSRSDFDNSSAAVVDESSLLVDENSDEETSLGILPPDGSSRRQQAQHRPRSRSSQNSRESHAMRLHSAYFSDDDNNIAMKRNVAVRLALQNSDIMRSTPLIESPVRTVRRAKLSKPNMDRKTIDKPLWRSTLPRFCDCDTTNFDLLPHCSLNDTLLFHQIVLYY